VFGAGANVEHNKDKNPVIALREIACQSIDVESMRSKCIKSLQKHANPDVIDNNHTSEEAELFNQDGQITVENELISVDNYTFDEDIFIMPEQFLIFSFLFLRSVLYDSSLSVITAIRILFSYLTDIIFLIFRKLIFIYFSFWISSSKKCFLQLRKVYSRGYFSISFSSFLIFNFVFLLLCM
jgi:hypothetical protein